MIRHPCDGSFVRAFFALMTKYINGEGVASTEQMATKAANLADLMVDIRNRAINIRAANPDDDVCLQLTAPCFATKAK